MYDAKILAHTSKKTGAQINALTKNAERCETTTEEKQRNHREWTDGRNQ
jgi:hypothetical protein